MRIIKTRLIEETIYSLTLEAAFALEGDLIAAFQDAQQQEDTPIAKSVLESIITNQKIAKEERIPICQDTGIVVIFLEIGESIFIEGDLDAAIHNGIKRAYKDGYLRNSVADPITRVNTQDNTPAIIHTKRTQGDFLTIHVLPKGAGSENMSKLIMLPPTAGEEKIIEFILDSIQTAGGKPCPPIIVGVGIGGNFELSALLAKEALLRPINDIASEPHIAALEAKLLSKINALDIGPMGFGGKTTALAVKINTAPTHIASLPVAINLSCHAHRHKSKVI